MKKSLLCVLLLTTTVCATDIVCQGDSTQGLQVSITLSCQDCQTKVNRMTTEVDHQVVSTFENPQIATSPYDDESEAFIVIGENEDEGYQTALGVDLTSSTLGVVYTPELALMIPSIKCQ